jgi:two-component system, chemotaxis family, protein-glutamate methylesterase/glutaminase
MRSKLAIETRLHELRSVPPENVPEVGQASSYTCAECGGPIEEIHEGTVVRFRCQVGHGFTVHALLLGRLQKAEEATWNLVSTFMESARLSDLLGRQAQREGLASVARKFKQVHDSCTELADLFRSAVQRIPDATLDATTPDRKRPM